MIEKLRQLLDWDTAKVVGAATAGIGANLALIDYALKFIISGLTIWYLWRKIHKKDNN